MKRYDSNFIDTLDRFDFETIENSKQSIFGLSSDLKLIYFNTSWIQFADENSTEHLFTDKFGLGTSINDIVPQVLLMFYTEKYQETLLTGKVWHHDYECSSSQTYRIFNQSCYPLKNGSGLLIVNKIRIEKPMEETDRVDHDPIEKLYTHETGFIHQCSNCRSIQRVDDKEKWDWVSSWVKDMPKHTSHTIGPVCFDYYWKNAD